MVPIFLDLRYGNSTLCLRSAVNVLGSNILPNALPLVPFHRPLSPGMGAGTALHCSPVSLSWTKHG